MVKRVAFLTFCLWAILDVCNAQFDVDAFWNAKRAESKEFTAYQQDQSKLKISSRNLLYDRVQQEFLIIEQIPVDSVERDLLAQINELLVGHQSRLHRIIIVNALYPNASVTPLGVVRITVPLSQMLTPDELIAVIAHEVAHYRLLHTEINFYATSRKERNNEIWAGVITGLTAGVNMTGPVLSASAGMPISQSQINRTTENNVIMGHAVSDVFARNAEMWGYQYSREQELEADILAAQLLDSTGVGRDVMLSAYEKLRSYAQSIGENTAMTYKKSDHPGWDERIDVVRNRYESLQAYKRHYRRVLRERQPFYDF